MNRFPFYFVSLSIFILAMVLFSGSFPALGEKTFDEGDLDGTYSYIFMQVLEISGVEHCSGYGTISFDGAGAGEINSNDQCEGGSVESGFYPHTYTVSPEGVVEITTPGDITRCQIVDKGKILLCDGTTRIPPPAGEHLSWIAIGVKQ